jgi:glutaredoxin 3
MSSDAALIEPAVMIYTQALCGYCAAARALLREKGVAYDEINVTLNAKLRREMVERSGGETVPQIFIGKRHIGGYDEMAALDDAGQLDKLLGLTK